LSWSELLFCNKIINGPYTNFFHFVITSLTVNLETKIEKKILLLKLQGILHQNISEELLYLTLNVKGNFIIGGACIIIGLLILF
jgi:hypothetical protein